MSEFEYKESGNVGYFAIRKFEESNRVKTCFSTRVGGVSEGSFYSLNLGYKSGDAKDNIDENFNILCKASGFDINNMVLSDQTHEAKYKIARGNDRGKGIVLDSDICGIDALITNERNVALCIFTADCVPVFLFDSTKNAIALCHAGWRGVVKEIIPKTIEAMKAEYCSEAENMFAAIGPSIGPCCFNVGQEVVMEFKNVFDDINQIVISEKGKIRIDLWKAVEVQLIKAGLLSENVTQSKLCTSCDNEKFYSYRREGSKTGRMVSILQLI